MREVGRSGEAVFMARHGRACPGHPRLSVAMQGVDARDKRGHDGGGALWLAKPACQPTIRRGGTCHGRPHQPLSRRLRALAARSAGLLGRGRGRDRLDRAGRRPCSMPRPASMAAGSPARSATPATTRSTATCCAAAASQPALIYDSPVTNTKRTFTYAELLAEVETLAAMLKDFGVGKGDRVILYMPMVPEALFAMLACARIGAIHSVVFGGFAAKELATRIDDCKPKLILSASCGIEVDARRPLQAAARRGDRACRRHKPRGLPHPAAPAARSADDRRPRPRLGDAASTPR